MTQGSFIETVSRLIGSTKISLDEAQRELASRDIFGLNAGVVADAIFTPQTAEDVSHIVRTAATYKIPLAIRGGGMSYTGGYQPERNGAIIDMSRFDSVSVNIFNATATVGAGCTWAKLDAALEGSGLETVLGGPVSGERSTIGGALSQGLPGDNNGVVGLKVIVGTGALVTTGHAFGEDAFTRNAGPDFTAMFLGDAGTLGVKLEATLRLRPRLNGVAHASLAFASLPDLAEAAAAVARSGLARRCLGLDPGKSRSATKVGLREGLSTLGQVVKGGKSLASGLCQAGRIVASLAQSPHAGAWMLHLTTEAVSDRAATDMLAELRHLCHAAIAEVQPSVPVALRARPYSIRGVAGADGERWVPVNGIVAPDQARPVAEALNDFAKANRDMMAADAIQWSMLVSATPAQVLFEPMFLWRDELAAVALDALGPQRAARLQKHPADLRTREKVAALRDQVRGLLDRFGAAHAGYGSYYPYPSADTDAGRLLPLLRQSLDPSAILSPANLRNDNG